MDNNFNSFAIPSGHDDRDYRISQFVPGKDIIKDQQYKMNLPEQNVVPTQNGTGACVAYSLAICKSILEYNAINKWIDFSAPMIYGHRKPEHWQSIGIRPREALDNLIADGAWFRRDFDVNKEVPALYDDVKKARKEKPNLNTQALNYTISGYARLYTIDDVKSALKAGMPVTGSWYLYTSFYSVKSDGKVALPKENEAKIESHQMTIIGWTSKEWITINSWGTSRAHSGVYYFPFEYAPYEMWCVSDTIFPAKRKSMEIKIVVGNKSVLVDGVSKALDVPAMIINSRTYLPIRIIAEALGASVEWIQSSQEVIVRSEEAIVKLKIGSTTVNVDGSSIKSDVAPVIIDGRTMLPIRIICEYLNCKVDWNAAANMVTIKSK